jgi:hypothetical protein
MAGLLRESSAFTGTNMLLPGMGQGIRSFSVVDQIICYMIMLFSTLVLTTTPGLIAIPVEDLRG